MDPTPPAIDPIEDSPEFAPEPPPKGPVVWARVNLFPSVFNGLLSVISLLLIVFAIRGILGWIFGDGRTWSAVFTNIRLYMTQAYPINQFARVWVSLAIVLALVGFSLAAWRTGGTTTLRKLMRAVQGLGAGLAIATLLAPGALSGKVLWWAIFGAVFGVGFAIERSYGDRAKEIELPTLGIGVVLLGTIVGSLWVIPFGRYLFRDGVDLYESGTISLSTKGPITLVVLVLVGSYLAGKVLVGAGAAARMRSVLIGLWVLSLPLIVLVVLRDPAFDFGHVLRVDVLIWAVFVIGGGLVIAVLANPALGEMGRVAGGLLVVGSLAMWAVPMLIRIRLLGLLLALFAVGAPTFAAGDSRARIRYLALWAVMITTLVYLFAVLNTPSTLVIQGKTFLGGLILTFVLALTAIFLSFPIGVLMALGRTSTMPIFRMVSTAYIEMVRGIPFITVLIFFDLILVLFLPKGLEFDSVTLAIIAGTLFSGAYLAENVRGGLQAIPNGQYEAARAMGLSTLQLTVFIVLPQALRAVIPALVGQTIAIFKDTSLVAIIGLFDFLFIADKVIPAQTIFLGVKLENLLFIALVYWMFTFSFSRASLRIERKLGLGER